jgi:hypothetical protein
MAQISEVRGGGGYLSSNDLRLHFGLGADAIIPKVKIDWPSGKKEELLNLPGDSLYTILEGSGVKHALKLAAPTK